MTDKSELHERAIRTALSEFWRGHKGQSRRMSDAIAAYLAIAPQAPVSAVPVSAVFVGDLPLPKRGHWPDPTPEMLSDDPNFEKIWQAIKTWDINVPEVYGGYCGATGNHVRAIIDALASPPPPAQADDNTADRAIAWYKADGRYVDSEDAQADDGKDAEIAELTDDLRISSELLTAAIGDYNDAKTLVRELVAALDTSVVAINDWLHIYAEDECNADRVAEAKARVLEHGTLAYIAEVQEKNRAALTSAKAAGYEP